MNAVDYSIMGLPITGQVKIFVSVIDIRFVLTRFFPKNYNLISLAFYVGVLIFEFPTVYISQKTRVAKYLGVVIPVITVELPSDDLDIHRCQHHVMGWHPYVARSCIFLPSIFCSPVPPRDVRMLRRTNPHSHHLHVL